MQGYLEQAFGKSDVTSVKMRVALREWLDLYYGAPRPGEDAAPRLAALIVGKLCRTVFAEYETRLPPDAAGAARILPYPDRELTCLGIDEGDTVCLLPDGTLHKL